MKKLDPNVSPPTLHRIFPATGVPSAAAAAAAAIYWMMLRCYPARH